MSHPHRLAKVNSERKCSYSGPHSVWPASGVGQAGAGHLPGHPNPQPLPSSSVPNSSLSILVSAEPLPRLCPLVGVLFHSAGRALSHPLASS